MYGNCHITAFSATEQTRNVDVLCEDINILPEYFNIIFLKNQNLYICLLRVGLVQMFCTMPTIQYHTHSCVHEYFVNCSYQPIMEYIESQFDQYFKDESGLNRRNIKDNRVHCCLYFISPFGHG